MPLEDILAAPELSTASPWLNRENFPNNAPSDVALEKIPSQLLSRVRADSFATISPLTKGLLLRFSGYDGYPYAVQSSSDLINWTSVSTNLPSDGFFKFISATTADEPQFYRSKLLP